MNPKRTLSPIHFMRPGTHTSADGKAMSFSEADIAEMCASYDYALYRAPIVVGHPTHNDPAYGWVRSLCRSAGGAFAVPEQVEAQFCDLVEAGRLGAVSASIYGRTHPHNPTPGKLYVRHIGFLGANPPAIKGLTPPAVVSFADDDGGEVLTVSFGEYEDCSIARLLRNLREDMIAERGLEVADRLLPEWELSAITDAARRELDQAQTRAYETANLAEPAKAQADSTEVVALKKRVAELESQAKAAADQQRSAANLAFAEQMVAERRVLPRDSALLAALMDTVQAVSGKLEFGEGDARLPLHAAVQKFLSSLPATDFSEQATMDRSATSATSATSGATVGQHDYGENVDKERLALDSKIRERMKQTGESYAVAASHTVK